METPLCGATQLKFFEVVAPMCDTRRWKRSPPDSNALPIRTALKGEISCAMTECLAMSFPTKTAEDAHETRAFTASVPSFAIADPIGAASGAGNMAPHWEAKSIYLSTSHSAPRGPTENGPRTGRHGYSPQDRRSIGTCRDRKAKSVSVEQKACTRNARHRFLRGCENPRRRKR